MKMTDLSRCATALAIALFCGLHGCSPAVETPNSSVFTNAMADYEAGNYDAAIAGFQQVLKNDPKNDLAHFQLAVALQDKKKDYLGALVHYSLYLELRSADDKTNVEDRMRECKDSLVAEHARKTGNVSGKAPSAGEDKNVAAENARLKAEAARLQKEYETLRYLLSKMGETGKGRASSLSAEDRKLLAELRVSETEDMPRKTIIPKDTEILDAVGGGGSSLSSSAVKELADEVEREGASGSAHPKAIQTPSVSADELSGATPPPVFKRSPIIVDRSTRPVPNSVPGGVQSGGRTVLMGGGKKPSGAARPDTYVVQSGDNLMKIAARFYGSRHKWRDIQRANAATVDFDGNVKVGQVIKLP